MQKPNWRRREKKEEEKEVEEEEENDGSGSTSSEDVQVIYADSPDSSSSDSSFDERVKAQKSGERKSSKRKLEFPDVRTPSKVSVKLERMGERAKEQGGPSFEGLQGKALPPSVEGPQEEAMPHQLDAQE
ncbi:hypothetical protein WMY93_015415 [Mugilogobius chulae]|uniref:Uncharacterized protein n=1 Tax=Mugilogobius chulae TaxID=88201 RepID=A0AAW0P280_9GOBI